MNLSKYRIQIGLIFAIGISAVASLVLPAGSARQLAVYCLLWILPALGWMLLIRGYLSERFLIAAGIALLANMVIALWVSYIPGRSQSGFMLFGVLILVIAPVLFSLIELPTKVERQSLLPKVIVTLVAIMLIAILLRLPNLGYKELQGDEGIIMARAAAIITGDVDELFLHQKGPAEILFPLITWELTGTINDFWLRLPFMWAGWLAVLALFWLARTWFSDRVGLISALLFAIGGFAVAFSRIAQYQSFVVLFGALALFSAARFRLNGRRSDLFLSIIFLSGGFLAHYDAILFTPAIAWILVAAYRENHLKVRTWGLALLSGLVLLAIFYIPYALAPNFGKIINYLVGTRVGVQGNEVSLAGGASAAWQMSTFYNSIWYVLGILVLTAIGLVILARKRSHFEVVLYFVVPALFYILLVRDPRTHIYSFFPGAAVLAGVGANAIVNLVRGRDNKVLSISTAIVAVIWLVVTVLYPYLLFVDVEPERQRTWSNNRPIPVLYPTTWQEPPLYGLFGFPHQSGWRLVHQQLDDLDLPYASNEEEEITNWYMSQAQRTHCSDYQTFVLASNVQDPVPFDAEVLAKLSLQSRITVGGQTTMEIFGQQEVDSVRNIEALGSNRWVRPDELVPSMPSSVQPMDEVLGDEVKLIGFELSQNQVSPGENLFVTLYWQALAPMTRNRQVFVHLNNGELVAQHDGAPECALNPVIRWEPGQIVADTHIITLPDNLPGGSIPVFVGMYDLLSNDRLSVPGHEDNAIYLIDITVRD